MPVFEIRRKAIDVTMDGTLGGVPDTHRQFMAGPACYYVDGVEVTEDEYKRLVKEWEARALGQRSIP